VGNTLFQWSTLVILTISNFATTNPNHKLTLFCSLPYSNES